MSKSKFATVISAMTLGVIFVLIVMLMFVAMGIIRFDRVKLSISTADKEALYNGQIMTNHQWNITSGTLKDGHSIKCTVTGAQNGVGESQNLIDVVILDELETDVTDDYNISFDLGTLKVNPRILRVKKDENGTYQVEDNCDGLVIGHKLVKTTAGNGLGIKIVDLYGQDVTRNYQILSDSDLGGSSGGSGNSGGSGGGSGSEDFSSEDFFSSSSNMSPPENMKDVVLFSVLSQKSGSFYLKRESYGDYNGKAFLPAPTYSNYLDGKYSAYYLTANSLMHSGFSQNRMTLESYCDAYMLPYYTEMGQGEVQSDDARFSGNTDSSYRVTHYILDDIEALRAGVEYINYELAYRQFVYNNYLYIDSVTRSFMARFITEQGIDKHANRINLINQVALYVREAAVYNLDYNPKLETESNVAIAFLRDYKEGVCRHYAMAATLIYRTLGIPARYTVGLSAEVEAGQWTDITADRGHAWVEVYLDGIGWVHVEVTGSSPDGGGNGGSGGAGLGGLLPGGLGGGDSGDGPGGGDSGDGPSGEKPGDGPGGDKPGDGDDNDDNKDPNKPTVKFVVNSKDKRYDGFPLHAVECSTTVTGFDEYRSQGYYYEVLVSGSQTEPGKSDVIINEIHIYTGFGEDVTDQFNVESSAGTLHVYDRVIRFMSPNCEKVYDGLLPDSAVLSGGILIDGHAYHVISTAKSTVGASKNTYEVKIIDSYTGEDVTDFYKIIRTFGDVQIHHLPITVKPRDVEKIYDGTELTPTEIDITSGALLEGHYIAEVEFYGSQTKVGRSESVVKRIVIMDREGNDVTANYSINLETGKIKVTRP